MKFVIKKNLLRKNPFIYLSAILVVLIAFVQTKSLNVNNLLERISSGDLNEKDVLDFYKKDYDASLEFHQFFQPCLEHLIHEEMGKANSVINKWFPGAKNYFSSNYSELEYPELGLKIKCEVYINKFVSKEYILKKKEEANPVRDSIESCRKELSNLEKTNQNLLSRINANKNSKSNTINSFNFKSDENGPKIEYQNKPDPLSIGDNKVEFQTKPDNNDIGSLNLSKSSDSQSSSKCNEELQKIKVRVTRLEKDNKIYEKQIVEKNRLIQIKDEQNNKNLESNTKMKLEIAEKEKTLNDCQNKKIDLKSSLDKCKIKVGSCGVSNCAECENKLVTKIDEFTACEKIKKNLIQKNHDLSDQLTTLKIQITTLDIGKNNVEKKLTDCNHENQNLLKKLTKSESQATNNNYKSCAELDQCKKTVKEKINEILILKKTCKKADDPTVKIKVKKGTCEEENERLKTELKYCNQKQAKYVLIIQEKNTIIIKKESEISTLEIEKNNIKTTLEKVENDCREEKDSYEKKITKLEEIFREERKKHQICRNELKDNRGFKKKWEKCEENIKKERTKCKEVIVKQKTEIVKIRTELDKCEKDNKRYEIDIRVKISAFETCEKEKDDLLKRLRNCTNNLEEEKQRYIEFSNEVTIIKERIVIEHQKKCKVQIDTFNTKIIEYEKEIRELRLNQDCPVKLTKCYNEKEIIENTLKTKEITIIKIKEEKDTCENELKRLKEDYIKIKTKETVCQKSREETHINWRNCEDRKPVPCPNIDESIIINIRRQYEKCNYEISHFKDDIIKYKETIERYEKIIREYEERKNKCVGNCTEDLETCQRNIIQIQNKCDEEIRVKIEEINIFRKRILNNEEKCSKKIRDYQENNKKCIRQLKITKTRFEDCQKNYIKEVTINKKYVTEITNVKTQLDICLKRQQCNKGASKASSITEKWEKQKTVTLKEIFSLKEKITQLEEQKKSIYMSSKHIISFMRNKCEKDIDSYDTVMEDMENRIKHYYSFKIKIEGEIRSDEITIARKQKEINVKTEEKNIITTEITNIRSDYERIIIETNNIRDKIKRSGDIQTIKTLTERIFLKERELKEKNELILKTSQKEREIINVIVIIQEQINNYTIIKNIKYLKIKENQENIEKMNKILIQVKKTIEIKKSNKQKVGVKIDKFTNVRIITDARMSALEKEKETLTRELETCNRKLEDEKSTNNLLNMKINNNITSGLIDVNLLMRIFEDNSFTERNCLRLHRFKTKFYKICPNKSNTEHKFNRHKNTPVESQHPLGARDLGIESQEPISGFESLKIKSEGHGEGRKNVKIESQFPLKNRDLKVESQHPLSDQILASGASSSSSSSSSSFGSSSSNSSRSQKIESQFPLKNRDLKIESQHPLNNQILNDGASSASSSSSFSSSFSNSGRSQKIESQFPLKNRDLKIESQHPLNDQILASGASTSSSFSSSSSNSSKNQQIESQYPLKNRDLKIESQNPLNRNILNSGASSISSLESQFPLNQNVESQSTKKFRNEFEENAKIEKASSETNSKEKALDLNQSLTKLLDAGKN